VIERGPQLLMKPFDVLLGSRLAVQRTAQWQRVDKKADGIANAIFGAAQHRRTNREVLLTGETRKERRPGREHDHKRSGTQLLCQRIDPCDHRRRNRERDQSSALCTLTSHGSVTWQFQAGEPL
jgi:hypothetical protein